MPPNATGVVGAAIRARLASVGVSVAVFNRHGAVSRATLNRLLAGRDEIKDPALASSLERALGWVKGSLAQVRAGGTPTAIPIRDWPRQDGDWSAAVEAAWREYDEERESALDGFMTPAPIAPAATGVETDADRELRRLLGDAVFLSPAVQQWPAWLRERAAITLVAAEHDKDLTGDPAVLGYELVSRAMGLELIPSMAATFAGWFRDHLN